MIMPLPAIGPGRPGGTARDFTGSMAYRQQAMRHLAFGVSSTPRGRQAPAPIVIDHAAGVRLTDIDGNAYIDYALGYGPLFLGHSPAPVMAALRRELDRGLRTASVHEGEARLAELIAQTVPCAERSAFVSTGTEAVQLAIRISRAATGKVKLVKFRGNYHGWFDNVHVAGTPGDDGPATIGQDPGAHASVVVLDWGDGAALERVLTSDFAAVLLEPAAINGGCFAPPAGFLEHVRALTARLGVVLIFDEIITGFRLALGGAQERYCVLPDLTVLGKALGAGLPIGAVCGPQAFMEPISSGRLLHRGTFNGNPLSVAAGAACLEHLIQVRDAAYPRAERLAAALRAHVEREAERVGAPVCANQVGPIVQIFAGARQIQRLQDVGSVDQARTSELATDLLRSGINVIPRGLMYISTVHDDADVAETMQALSNAIERSIP